MHILQSSRVWSGTIGLVFLVSCKTAEKPATPRTDINLQSWTYRPDRWDVKTQGKPPLSLNELIQVSKRFASTLWRFERT